MMRRLAISAAVVVALAVAAYAAAPAVARHVAERQVDKALKQIRRDSVSTANRGEVSVDLRSRTVTVRDIAVAAPGDVTRIRIGTLTVVDPFKHDGALKADLVAFEGIEIRSEDETIRIPRIEIHNYEGPARGLVTTPGVGRMARSQADVIARVSLAGANIPSIEMVGDVTKIRRRISDVTIGAVKAGIVQRATVGKISIDSPEIPPGPARSATMIDLTTGPAIYERFSLPTLWRFYANDGAGDRQTLAGKVSVSNVSARLETAPSGRVSVDVGAFEAREVKLRPLAEPVSTFDWIASGAVIPEAKTPAELRRQLLLFADVTHAIAFDRISATAMRVESDLPERPKFSAELSSLEVGPYADARVGNVSVKDARYADDDPTKASIAHAEAANFDAGSLIDYLGRVGRNEVMMMGAPTTEDVMRLAPRLSNINVSDVVWSGAGGDAKAATASASLNAPPGVVPQHIAVRLDDIDVDPHDGTRLAKALRAAAIDRIRGSADVAMTLDPSRRELSLDALNSDIEQIGAVRAKGAVADFDPALPMFRGLKLFEKASDIVLKPFTVLLTNDGGVDTAIKRAADAADEPHDLYRETIAQRAEDEFVRVLGPSSVRSGQALAEFVRNPRTVEFKILPKTGDVKLMDFIRSLDLGPAGVAQTIDVAVLNRR